MANLVTALVSLLGGILAKTEGTKTYLAAAGLIGMAVYQASVGSYDKATETFFLALGYLGLRSATAGVAAKLPSDDGKPTPGGDTPA